MEIEQGANPVYELLIDIFGKVVHDNVLTCGPYEGLECMADTLYVYNRAIKPCEIRARYRTQVSARTISEV
eukprot:2313427-Pyramimonas_sp.AAC.1